MTNCKLCQEEIKGMALACSKGTICMKCSDNITDAEYQPLTHSMNILWCLSETYFRKGKGEDITFRQVWEKGDNTKLISFDELCKERYKKKVKK